MAASSTVTTGDIATAASYNNLRADVLSNSASHTHTGASDNSIKVNSNDLQGTTLASTVVASSLTSVATLTTLTVDSIIINGTNIGHTSDTDAIAIASSGVVTMNQIPVFSAGINVSGGTIAGTLSTAAQANITSVGTLTDLTVSGTSTTIGTVTSGIWNAGAVTSSGAVTGASLVADNITIDGTTVSTSTGALTIDGDDGIVLQTTGSGHVTTAENVGIGETAPANLLHVKVSDTGITPHASAQIVLERDGTNYLQFLTGNDGTSGLLFGDEDDNDVAKIYYDHNVPAMYFATEANVGMTLAGGATPVLKLFGTASTGSDAGIVFDGEAQDYYIALDDGGDALFIGTDSTVGSNGAIIIDKKGGVSSDAIHVGINATPNINDLVTIGGTFAGYSNTHGLRIEPSLTAKAGNNASVVSVAGTLVEAGSGTHANLWGSAFSAPTVTGGSAAVTNTATVYVSGAMSAGTNNYALWVDAGVSRFDGNVGIGGSGNAVDHELHVENSGANSTPAIKLENDAQGYRLQVNGGDSDKLQLLTTSGFDTFFQFNPSTNDVALGVSGNEIELRSDVKITGTTPTLTIGDAGTEDTAIVFDGAEHDFYVGLDDSTNYLTIGEGSTVGTNPYIRLVPSLDFAYGMVLGGTTTSGGQSDTATGVAFMPHITSHSGDDVSVSLVRIGGELAGQSMTLAGDTGIATSLHLSEPSITTGGNTITNSATLYIKDAASEATNDYALWVDSGTTRLDGSLYVDSYFQMSSNNGGNANKIHLNNSGTSAASDATVEIYVNGQNDSDPTVVWATTYSTNVYWSAGIDQSNSKSFAISNDYSIGTNDALRITAATPPVTTYNTTHPTGTFDYVCESCGRHEAEQFECCGKVEWHDDVIDFRGMALRNPDAIDYMEKIGVIERTIDAKGKPEVFTVLGRDFEFAMSAAFQNRQRMDSQYKETVEKINRLEKELQELRS